MKTTGWKTLLLGMMLTLLTGMLAACGTGSGSGSGPSSSRASLDLKVSSSTAVSGTPITATVTLTSLDGTPTNGIYVRIMSSDNSVVADASGYTNGSGIAVITLPVKTVPANKSIVLVAGSDGVTQSNAVSVQVSGPKLTFNLAQPALPDVAFTGGTGIASIVMSGVTAKFVDGNNNPINGQTVSLYIDSITNKQVDDQIVFNPVQGSAIIAPPGVYTGVTDNSGNMNVPMTIRMLMPPIPASGTTLHVITINWRVVAVYGGITYTQSGSSSQTITNAPAQ